MEREKTEIYSRNPYEGTDFPLLVLHVDQRRCEPENKGFLHTHWHEELQFVYVRKGRVTFRVYGERWEMREGQGMFLNRSCLHQIDGHGESSYRSFLFPEKMVSFYEGSRMEAQEVRGITEDPVVAGVPLDECFPQTLCHLRELCRLEEKRGEAHWEYRMCLELAWLWLVFLCEGNFPQKKAGRALEKGHERIRKMTDFIHKNYSGNIRLADIAQAAFLSRSQCLRCFERYLQCTPGEYLQQYRMRMALDALEQTEDSVTEIAFASGFGSASYFNKCFKMRLGITPTQYRRGEKDGLVRCGG